jgi:hypothetical protein
MAKRPMPREYTPRIFPRCAWRMKEEGGGGRREGGGRRKARLGRPIKLQKECVRTHGRREPVRRKRKAGGNGGRKGMWWMRTVCL